MRVCNLEASRGKKDKQTDNLQFFRTGPILCASQYEIFCGITKENCFLHWTALFLFVSQ